MKGVVLLSGGIDSSTTLAVARDMGYDTFALTILYGQRHEREVRSARDIASSMGVVEHTTIQLPNDMFRSGSLTTDEEVPEGAGTEDNIPSTYVPARNLVFLSIAVGYAEVISADSVFIGVTSVDYSGYPDCRPEFIRSFQETSRLGTKRGIEGHPIRIITPLIDMSKEEIIKWGRELGVDYSLTWSCYRGGEKACGRCDSCKHRLKGFERSGIEDPVEYEVVR